MMISPSMQQILRQDKELLQALLHNLDKSLKKRRKHKSQLRFARPTDNGWSFFTNKQIPWDVLEEVTSQTAKKHTHCSKGFIAHTLSHVVSISEREFGVLAGLVL